MKFTGEKKVEKKVTDKKPNLKTSEIKDKKYRLVFKHNRSHELHLNGKVWHRFEPNESMEVDEKIINHKDFTEIEKQNFVIKEL